MLINRGVFMKKVMKVLISVLIIFIGINPMEIFANSYSETDSIDNENKSEVENLHVYGIHTGLDQAVMEAIDLYNSDGNPYPHAHYECSKNNSHISYNLQICDVCGAVVEYHPGNCTWQTWEECYTRLGIKLPNWNSASNWHNGAAASGYTVIPWSSGYVPPSNCIIEWAGHVAWCDSADSVGVNLVDGNIKMNGQWVDRNYQWWSWAQLQSFRGNPKYVIILNGSSPVTTTVSFDNNGISKDYSHPTFSFRANASKTGKFTASGVAYHRVGHSEEYKELGDSGLNINLNYCVANIDFLTEHNTTLQPGTDYQYRYYVDFDGTRYWSDIWYFTSSSIAVTGITVSPATVNIVEGNTYSLTATVTPSNATNKTVTWTSSNTAVATVSNGTVTGKSAGTATITAKTSNGLTATCKVTVKAKTVDVTKITVSPTTASIVEGNTYSLTAAVTPSNATDKTVTWTSSNTAIATVSNGTVTGKSAGTATITAKASNGMTATCTVTVRTRTVEVTGITVSQTTASIVEGNTYPLTATVTPGNATDKTVEWTSSNTAVATVTNGTVKGVSAGTATITAKTSNGLTATCKVTVKAKTVDVTKITVSPTTASIVEGNTYSLTAAVTPGNATDKTVTWTSSNKAVATVTNGTVKGVSAGTATITAKASNGMTATCKVTVTAKTVKVTGVALNKTSLNVVKGKTATLKATVSPSDAANKAVTWKSSNTGVLTVSSSGKITAKTPGKATVTVTTADGSYTAKCTVRVQFTDVTDTGEFFYTPVYNLVDKKVIEGWSDGTFRPYNVCNRASVVTFLWRMKGKPSGGTAKFKDLTGNSDFDKAIAWASQKGIAEGYSDNTFRPWVTCNRAAVITFIWRAAGKPVPTKMASFKDMTGNTDFDLAISWASEKGITTGYSDNTFRPWDTCTRAAIVSFLYRARTYIK